MVSFEIIGDLRFDNLCFLLQRFWILSVLALYVHRVMLRVFDKTKSAQVKL